MAMLNGETHVMFQPPKKRQRLESFMPAVQVKAASTAKGGKAKASEVVFQNSDNQN